MVNDHIEHIKFRYAVYMVASFVSILWIIKAVELAGDFSFSSLGILPRTLRGIIGIITGPLIHGDIFHLISNSVPLFLLGILLFYFYNRIAVEIFIWIYLVSGFWTWMLARNAYHIGASGIVYGMVSFLFFSGIIRKNKQLMTVSGIIILLYGGFLYGIFPDFVEEDVSWESHALGALVGVLLAIVFRKTKIDFDQNNPDEDLPDEDKKETHFHHTGSTEYMEIKYTYKPKGKDQ